MKRVTLKPKLPNPLFEKWLKEWKDEAAAKNSDMQYGFSKALASLKKFPLVLESGRDCIILQNFGAKLCQMLDKKLAEYRKTNSVSALSNDQNNGMTNDDIDSEVLAKKPRRKVSKTKETVDDKKKKRSTSSSAVRPYIPTWRSGGYAILLTLYKKTEDPDYIGYMTKADLQAEAQPLCDKSLKKADPGSQYSAWSSMSTLIQKELVIKKSNPAKYSLTDYGMAVAMQLLDSSENDHASIESYQSTYSSNDSKHERSLSKVKSTKSRPTSATTERLMHSISPEPDDLIDLEAAWEDNDQLLAESEPSGNLPNCSKYKATAVKATSTITNPNGTEKGSVDLLFPVPDDVARPDSFSNSSILPEFNHYQNGITTSALNERQSKKSNIETAAEKIADKPKSRKQKKKDIQSTGSKESQDTLTNSGSSTDSTFVLQPHSFDVILLVDTQETAGGKTRPRDDATIVELSRTKVLFEVRHLKIGDFAWIARCRDSNRELVLPYIVERKRMDDLGGSIKDGRFHEQKFRLKHSGIQNLIYMVESHGNNQHTGLPLTTLYQAAVNTLVQDGFTVKYKNNHRDSMLYLASLTTLLTQIYQKKKLITCKKENLVPTNVTNDSIPVMNFEEFNKAASKMKNFNEKEMFIRQLLRLNGISVEKAIAIVEIYPTPKLLVQAFQNIGSNGEKLLADIKCGPMKRQLGPMLSKSIYQLYTRRDFG